MQEQQQLRRRGKEKGRIREQGEGDLFVCKLVTKSADRSGRARIAMARTVVAAIVVVE